MTAIPSRNPDGTRNRAYTNQYRQRRKDSGNPIVRPNEKNTEWQRRYRATAKGNACVKKYNDSEKGKAARARYMANHRRVKRRETGDEYASRIIRELESKTTTTP